MPCPMSALGETVLGFTPFCVCGRVAEVAGAQTPGNVLIGAADSLILAPFLGRFGRKYADGERTHKHH
jgi:hypothetical protein